MKNKLTLLSLVAMFCIAITISSCTKDVIEDIIPVEKVTFDADIKSIITANCAPCHVDGGGETNYTTYNNAANGITSIISLTNKNPGETNFMPKNGTKLSQTNLDLLAKWKADGTLEN